MNDLIGQFGLFAIFVGAALEGEPFALAGGVFAHRGWISLYGAVPAAIAGAICIDQFWFHLSRNFRESRPVQKVVHRPGFRRALALVDRHPLWFVLLFRFAYGLRSIAAVAIGLSTISTKQFLALNIVAATAWGTLFTVLGYYISPAFETAYARYGWGLTAAALIVSVAALAVLVRKSGR